MQHDQKPTLAQHLFKEDFAFVHHGQTPVLAAAVMMVNQVV
jgi:hypothetical protein